MNCKPGDLAIFVKSCCGNEGKIVRCIRLLSSAQAAREEFAPGALWEIDTLVLTTYGDVWCRAFDEQLRPLRDPGDGAVDEMVKIVGKPKEKEISHELL